MATKKILKVGNSLAVIIPAEIIQSLSLKVGDRVKLNVDTKKSKLTLTFPGARQLPLLREKVRKRVKKS